MIYCSIKSQHFRHNTRICFWPQLPALQAMCLLSTAPVRPTFILPCSKTLRRKQNTRHMRSRGYCWEPRQWCQRASKGHNPGTGTSGPQDEAQDSAEDRKQIHRAPGAKQSQHSGDYKVEEASDKCLLNGSLRMDLCDACAPNRSITWDQSQ